MNRSMSNRSFCDTSGMLLAAMVVYVGSLLPAVALGDQQNVRADERAGTTGPPLAVEPFDAATAKGHQEAWAKHLGVPVEMTNSIGMKMVLIPPGEFVMGSPENEEGRLGDEGPQHRVRITKPYYLGMYEVTQGEYERVMDTNPSAFSRNGNRSGRVSGQDTSRFPVERVYWDDALDFCQKVSTMSSEQAAGRIYRLPTEAEWEYACRAGTTTPFHFGSQLNGREANCDGNNPYGTTKKGTYLERPTAVGSYSPNGFGLYDMHGNVLEWCLDRYDKAYYATSPMDDPTGPASGWAHVSRGGGWSFSSRSCRSAYRWYEPFDRADNLGFRIAFSLVDQSDRPVK